VGIRDYFEVMNLALIEWPIGLVLGRSRFYIVSSNFPRQIVVNCSLDA